jgi:hypothetical protein
MANTSVYYIQAKLSQKYKRAIEESDDEEFNIEDRISDPDLKRLEF